MNFFGDRGVREPQRIGHTRLHDHSQGRKNAFGHGFGSDGRGSPKPRLRQRHRHRIILDPNSRDIRDASEEDPPRPSN